MNVKDLSKNGYASKARMDVDGTAPSGGLTNVSGSDNSPVNMNTPGMKARGFRADQLVEMAGNDSYSLGTEAPRRDKMKG